MIHVKMTKNYTGFKIIGNYDDFYELYDNMMIALGDECLNENIENARLHALGFLYDLRHAYQGEREVIIANSDLSEEIKRYHGIKENVDHEVLYAFNYVIPEALADILIFKYFLYENRKEVVIDEFDQCYNSICLFQSKLIDALEEMLTVNQMKKVKMELYDSTMLMKDFIFQWFDLISVEYINSSKKNRKIIFMDVLDRICNFFKYHEFKSLKDELEQYAIENDVPIGDIEGVCEYPDEIKW